MLAPSEENLPQRVDEKVACSAPGLKSRPAFTKSVDPLRGYPAGSGKAGSAKVRTGHRSPSHPPAKLVPARVWSCCLEEAGDARSGEGSPMKSNDDWDVALFAVAQEGGVDGACEALAAGASVNAVNVYHLTPLLVASGEGHLELTRDLIGEGAENNYTGMRLDAGADPRRASRCALPGPGGPRRRGSRPGRG